MYRIICQYCLGRFLVARKRQKYCKIQHRKAMWKKRMRIEKKLVS